MARTRRPPGWTVACALWAACSAPPTPEQACQRQVAALWAAEARRVHGLSAGESHKELLGLLEQALQCAGDAERQRVLGFAALLEARLMAQGNAEELLNLARLLPGEPGDDLRQRLRDGAQAARARLEQRAIRLGEHARAVPATQPRARAALEAWLGAPPPPLDPPATTSLIINSVSAHKSCVTLLPGLDLHSGTAVLGLRRAGQALPLHGEAAAFVLSEDRRAVPRRTLCTNTALQGGDMLTVRVADQPELRLVMEVTEDDRARGSAWTLLAGARDRPAACDHAVDPDARTACSLWGMP